MQRLLKLLVFLFIVFSLGFAWFAYNAYKKHPFYANKTDAVIVVGNHLREIKVAINVVKLGYTPVMFVNSNQRLKLDELLIKHGIPQEQLITSGQIQNYSNNYLQNVSVFLKQNQVDTVRIIGDSSKISRFLLEFSLINHDIEYITYPVVINSRTYWEIVQEYIKYLATWFTIFIGYYGFSLSYT
ncbi:MAG: hypothetical protein DGJ47_000599 [Rickettsiaceae bacterium]